MRRPIAMTPFRVALLVTLGLLLVYLPVRETALVGAIEGQLLDLRFALRSEVPTPDEIVLVVIDDRSIREVGRWPWSRGVIADLLLALSEAGPRSIGIDLLFLEPEITDPSAGSMQELREALRRFAAQGEAVPADVVAELLADSGEPAVADRELAAALEKSSDAVIPFSFGFGSQKQDGQAIPPFVEAMAVRVARTLSPGTDVPTAETLMPPIKVIGEAAAGLGHANIGLDADGAARFEYPVIAYQGAYYPSFSLELARHFLGLSRDRIGLQLGRGVQLGERFLSTDETMRFVVGYGRPGRFPRVSAAAVLDGRVPAATFDDRLVLVGGAAAGVGGAFISPFTTSMPGIVRHATVLDNILRESFIVRRDLFAGLNVAFLLAAGLALGWVGARRRAAAAINAVFVLFLAALLGGNLFAFVRAGLWLDLFLPLIGLILLYAAVIGYTYFVGMREQRVLRNAFRHYLAPALVDRVAEDPSLLRLGGEEKELTVLFADVRNSTALGAKLPPAEFVQLLNECFDAMTREIFARGGMLDKFMGDGLLAVFGAPLPQPDHAERACRAALAMQDALGPLRARWQRPGLPEVDLGIGVNTGPMIIGNMGSAERFDYTVIGDEANLGARLEAANKELGTRILISEATFRQVEGKIAARELDVIRFRGMAREVRVFEVLSEAAEAERGRVE